MTFAVPVMILGLKVVYTLAMPYNALLAIFFVALIMIINLLIRSEWEMIAIASLFELIFIGQLLSGYMDSVSDGYALVIVNGVVTIAAGIISMYRYRDRVKILQFRDELILNKTELEQYSLLKDISIDLNHKLIEHVELDEYLKYIMKQMVDVIPAADAAAVLEVENGRLVMTASVNYMSNNEAFSIKVEDSFANLHGVIESKRPVIINNLLDFNDEKFKTVMPTVDGGIIMSSLSCPLFFGDKLYGLFNLDSTQNNSFQEKDVLMMSYFSEQMSVVLENHKLYAEVINLSKYDQLTGFRNRWYLNEIQEDQLPLWRRSGIKAVIALFDLDNLKVINDNYGHAVGDQYIVAFCDALRDTFRQSDIFIRNGGDEFLGVFFDIGSDDLEKLLEDLRNNIFLDTGEAIAETVPVLFSYGIVDLIENDNEWKNTLSLADERMYAYKAAHKD